MWGYHLINFILRAKYVAIFIKDILKELGNPILKGTANAIDEIRKEAKDDLKEERKQKELQLKERELINTNTQSHPLITSDKPIKEMSVDDKHAVVNKVYSNFDSMEEQILRNKIRSIGGGKNNKTQ